MSDAKHLESVRILLTKLVLVGILANAKNVLVLSKILLDRLPTSFHLRITDSHVLSQLISTEIRTVIGPNTVQIDSVDFVAKRQVSWLVQVTLDASKKVVEATCVLQARTSANVWAPARHGAVNSTDSIGKIQHFHLQSMNVCPSCVECFLRYSIPPLAWGTLEIT